MILKASAICVAMVLFVRVPEANAQGISWDIGKIQDAATSMVKWFKSLSDEVDEIADAEDKRRLIETLAELNKAIYDLEHNSDYLIVALSRPALIEPEVQQSLADTRQSLDVLRNRLHEVGLMLREHSRLGGAEVEEQIARATASRGVWLGDVEAVLTGDDEVPGELILQGQRVVQALRSSSIALIDLINQLQEGS